MKRRSFIAAFLAALWPKKRKPGQLEDWEIATYKSRFCGPGTRWASMPNEVLMYRVKVLPFNGYFVETPLPPPDSGPCRAH